MRNRWALLTMTLAVALAISCAPEDTPQKAVSSPAVPEARVPDLISMLKGRHQAGGSIRLFDSIADVLGNTEYQMDGRPPGPATEAVVVGEVISIDPGRAFTDERKDEPDGVETNFDDPDAVWRSIHVTLRVDETVSGSAEDQIVFGLATDPRMLLSDIETDLEELNPLILFLNRSPVFGYAPDIFGTLLDGGLIGTVDVKGRIQLPVMGGSEERQFLREADTLEELKEAAERPRRVLRFDASGRPLDE